MPDNGRYVSVIHSSANLPHTSTHLVLDSAESIEHDGSVTTGNIVDRCLESSRSERDGDCSCYRYNERKVNLSGGEVDDV